MLAAAPLYLLGTGALCPVDCPASPSVSGAGRYLVPKFPGGHLSTAEPFHTPPALCHRLLSPLFGNISEPHPAWIYRHAAAGTWAPGGDTRGHNPWGQGPFGWAGRQPLGVPALPSVSTATAIARSILGPVAAARGSSARCCAGCPLPRCLPGVLFAHLAPHQRSSQGFRSVAADSSGYYSAPAYRCLLYPSC